MTVPSAKYSGAVTYFDFDKNKSHNIPSGNFVEWGQGLGATDELVSGRLQSTRPNTTRRSNSGFALERIHLAQILKFREQLKGGYGRTNRFSELVDSLA